MLKLVKLKENSEQIECNNTFLVKGTVKNTLGAYSFVFFGVEDGKIYNPNDLIFINEKGNN